LLTDQSKSNPQIRTCKENDSLNIKRETPESNEKSKREKEREERKKKSEKIKKKRRETRPK
jgi:hypothetical protein